MPKPPLPPELDEFLKQPNPSVIGTVDGNDAPHTAATWYLWESGRVLVNMDASRKRLENLRRDPHASLTVVGRGDDWYRQVTLRGRVTDAGGSHGAVRRAEVRLSIQGAAAAEAEEAKTPKSEKAAQKLHHHEHHEHAGKEDLERVQDRLEPRDGTAPVGDHHGLAMADTVDEGAELVLGLGDRGDSHEARIATFM